MDVVRNGLLPAIVNITFADNELLCLALRELNYSTSPSVTDEDIAKAEFLRERLKAV